MIEIVHEAVFDCNVWEVRDPPKRRNDLNFMITEDCIPEIRRARFDAARNSQLSRVNGGCEKYRKQLVELRNPRRQARGVLGLVKCKRSLCRSSRVRFSLAARVNRNRISSASTTLQVSLSPISLKCLPINLVPPCPRSTTLCVHKYRRMSRFNRLLTYSVKTISDILQTFAMLT